MADVITLPSRSNVLGYTEDQIEDVYDALQETKAGEAVVCDEPQDTEAKARNRARMMKEAIEAEHDMKVKAHAVPDQEAEGTEEVTTRNGTTAIRTVYPDGTMFTPAVSIPLKDRK